MSYKALYRIYRPQTFDEVVGQKHILQTLRNAIKNQKIGHAYLFSGPRGTGKTTMAKLLAKAVNCLAPLEQRPCNQCANCAAITNGSYPDVIEIDAASNNGVEEVRELIDKVKYAPINGKYKVYIIDEVHMMTDNAFNALLKTLEEPPAHIIFIFATTEVHKVLPTILSRCQRFDFGRVAATDIKKRVQTILTQEGITFDPSVIDLIADLAEGGVRDAISILDQTIAYAGTHISEQHVRDIYGVASVAEIVQLIEMIGRSNMKEVLQTIEELDLRGTDITRLTSQLIDVIKESLVYSNTKEVSLLQRLSSEQADAIVNLMGRDRLFYFIDVLVDTLSNFRKVNAPRHLFELAMLKLCQSPQTTPTVNVVKPVKVEKVVAPTPKPVTAEVPVITKKEPGINATTQEFVPVPVSDDSGSESPVFELSDTEVIQWLVQMSPSEKAKAIERWVLISQYATKPAFARAANLLRDGMITAAAENALIISYPSSSQVRLVNLLSNQAIIGDLLKEVMGKTMVYYALTEAKMNELRELFKTLKKENKLPEAAPMVMKTTAATPSKKRASETFGESIFGSLLEVEK